jgi:hypothetical protein
MTPGVLHVMIANFIRILCKIHASYATLRYITVSDTHGSSLDVNTVSHMHCDCIAALRVAPRVGGLKVVQSVAPTVRAWDRPVVSGERHRMWGAQRVVNGPAAAVAVRVALAAQGGAVAVVLRVVAALT